MVVTNNNNSDDVRKSLLKMPFKKKKEIQKQVLIARAEIVLGMEEAALLGMEEAVLPITPTTKKRNSLQLRTFVFVVPS